MATTNISGPLVSQQGNESFGVAEFFDDFIGADEITAVYPPAAPTIGTPWTRNITGAAPPTIAAGADAVGGTLVFSLTATNEAQEAAIGHGDQRTIFVVNGGACVIKAQITTLPTLTSKFVFGLGSNRTADPDAMTQSIWIAVTSAGILLEADDGTTDFSVATGIVPVANDTFVFKIDFSSPRNLLYTVVRNPAIGKPIFVGDDFIRTAAPISFAATGASATLQPYIGAAKGAASAGVGVFNCDYYYVRMNR